MSLVATMVLGLAAGFILSRIVNRSGFVLDIILGVVGALIAGWLFSTFGMPGRHPLDLRYSLLVVVVGAALLLVVVIGAALLLAVMHYGAAPARPSSGGQLSLLPDPSGAAVSKRGVVAASHTSDRAEEPGDHLARRET